MQETNKEMLTMFCKVSPATLQWGTAGAEANVPSVENQEMTDPLDLPLKPGVGQNKAMHEKSVHPLTEISSMSWNKSE